jgi:hypothetical protein
MRTTLPLFLVLISCNPYDPNLGEDPFRCGTNEPRCPEGYGPVQLDDVTCVCQRGAPAAGGGGEFICNADPNEDPDGNESLSDSTPTPIGDGPTSWQQANVAVCEAGDVDVYSLTATAGETLTATLTFPTVQGGLTLDVLNSGDQSLAQGALDGSTMRAILQFPANGNYYVRVGGDDPDTRNNYTLRLQIESP